MFFDLSSCKPSINGYNVIMNKEMTDTHNEVLEEITQFLDADTSYGELEGLVDDGNFDSEEELRDFVRVLADHLGIECPMTREEAKEEYELMQSDGDRDMGIRF